MQNTNNKEAADEESVMANSGMVYLVFIVSFDEWLCG
jgi:hypothetical protein